ncbi:hypothetical protein CLF_106164 [Clonorchis sinensis]|uniref:Uncharacterized protein n=1 Tax=Clonorchis sinensis TaxID=79923 RepID=G7YPQ9_CLOSI|nr:hypothetical protein CLF_106164 [Clonorchis sinensis]
MPSYPTVYLAIERGVGATENVLGRCVVVLQFSVIATLGSPKGIRFRHYFIHLCKRSFANGLVSHRYSRYTVTYTIRTDATLSNKGSRARIERRTTDVAKGSERCKSELAKLNEKWEKFDAEAGGRVAGTVLLNGDRTRSWIRRVVGDRNRINLITTKARIQLERGRSAIFVYAHAPTIVYPEVEQSQTYTQLSNAIQSSYTSGHLILTGELGILVG